MIPAGYMLKKIVPRPDWIEAPCVVDIYSLNDSVFGKLKLSRFVECVLQSPPANFQEGAFRFIIFGMSETEKYKWEFKPRFRRGAFGWRSQPAVKRVKEAVREITK